MHLRTDPLRTNPPDTDTDTRPKAEVVDLTQRAIIELTELGFETTAENIENVVELMQTTQIPPEFASLLYMLNNNETLRAVMVEYGIREIVHTEGPTVWDHTKLAIRYVDILEGLTSEEREDLRIIMLYHDRGKAAVCNEPHNTTQTIPRLRETGILLRPMKGHEKARLTEIRAGLQSNGITGDKLDMYMTIIENHTHPDPLLGLHTYDRLPDFLRNLGKPGIKMMTAVLNADGLATETKRLIDGRVLSGTSRKKSNIRFIDVLQNFQAAMNKLEN